MRFEGFTILELLIAAGLITVSIFFVMGIIPTGARTLHQAEDMRTAADYADEVVEDALTHFPAAVAQATPTDRSPQIDRDFILDRNNTRFHVTRQLHLLAVQGTGNDLQLHEILVNVQRLDANGAPRGNPVQLVTRVTVHAAPTPTP